MLTMSYPRAYYKSRLLRTSLPLLLLLVMLFFGPTAPFLTAERLAEATSNLLESDADTLIPVVAFSYPPQRAMVIENGRLVFKYPEHIDARSQDLEKHYHDVGQFYVFRTEAFKKNRKLMLGNILPYEISEMEVQDIDTATDWEIAEMKYRILRGNVNEA